MLQRWTPRRIEGLGSVMSACVAAAAWLGAGPVSAESEGEGKYLVKVGWDGGGPQKLLDHLDTVRDLPFDGHTFKLGFKLQNAFWKRPIPREEFQEHFDAMAELMKHDLGNAKHNLVIIWCTGEAGWDWFNDEHWDAALHNMRMLTELAAAGNAELFFDPESYPKLTEHYGEHAFWVFNFQDQPAEFRQGRTIDDYRAVIFRRGQEFMRMVQEVDPEMDILSMYGVGTFSELLDIEDRQALLDSVESATYYNLLPSFFEGMLTEADEDFKLFDGNEHAYYYTRAEEFRDAREQVLSKGHRLMRPEFRQEFEDHYRMSHAIYASDLYAMDPDARDQYRAFFVQEMPREQEAEILAHNVYYALAASDRYAWFYTENDIDVYTGEIPDGMIEAIESAKAHLAEGRPYPTEISEVVAQANERYQRRMDGRLSRSTARSTLVTRTPEIDGRQDDPAWQGVPAYGPFKVSLPRQDSNYTPEEATTVRFAHDGEALYLLIEGDLHQRDKLKPMGTRRDDDVWAGDDIEIAVMDPNDPQQFYLLMVSPTAVRYDARVRLPEEAGGELLFHTDYDPTWDVAMSYPQGKWVVEFGIPWQAIGGQPRSDQDVRLNVARSHTNQPGVNFVNFSQVNTGFLDPTEFGTLRLTGP